MKKELFLDICQYLLNFWDEVVPVIFLAVHLLAKDEPNYFDTY